MWKPVFSVILRNRYCTIEVDYPLSVVIRWALFGFDHNFEMGISICRAFNTPCCLLSCWELGVWFSSLYWLLGKEQCHPIRFLGRVTHVHLVRFPYRLGMAMMCAWTVCLSNILSPELGTSVHFVWVWVSVAVEPDMDTGWLERLKKYCWHGRLIHSLL